MLEDVGACTARGAVQVVVNRVAAEPRSRRSRSVLALEKARSVIVLFMQLRFCVCKLVVD